MSHAGLKGRAGWAALAVALVATSSLSTPVFAQGRSEGRGGRQEQSVDRPQPRVDRRSEARSQQARSAPAPRAAPAQRVAPAAQPAPSRPQVAQGTPQRPQVERRSAPIAPRANRADRVPPAEATDQNGQAAAARRQVQLAQESARQQRQVERRAENLRQERNTSYTNPDRNRTYRDGSRDRDNRQDWRRRDNDGRGNAPSANRDRDNRQDWRNGRYAQNDRNQWRGNGKDRNDYRRWDNRWRDDHRYDWHSYRNNNRFVFRLGTYYAPYRSYSYSRLGIGSILDSLFFGSSYWIGDPWQYRLPAVYGPYRWVRYYDDVLLVDTYTGEVVDVIYDFFW